MRGICYTANNLNLLHAQVPCEITFAIIWNDLSESKLEPSLTAAPGQKREGVEGGELHLAQLRELGIQWRTTRRPQGGHGDPWWPRPPRDLSPHPELQQRALWVR